MKKTILTSLTNLCLAVSALATAAPSLTVDNASGTSGDSALIPVRFTVDTANPVSALSFDIQFNSSEVALAAPISVLKLIGEDILWSQPTANTMRFIVLPQAQSNIDSGVLFNIPVSILQASTVGSNNLLFLNPSFVNTNGDSVTGSASNGTVTVVATPPVDTSMDSDGDGIKDYLELQQGLNPNDVNDAALNYDSDGLSNYYEINTTHSNIHLADTDGDMLSDGYEQRYAMLGLNILSYTSPGIQNTDHDGDGLTLQQEALYGTSPTSSDSDYDRMPDDYEVAHGLNPVLYDAGDDADYDNLANYSEYYTYNTSPSNPDTDGDVMDDGFEVSYGLKPLVGQEAPYQTIWGNWVSHTEGPFDTADADVLTNLDEYLLGTKPTIVDSDGDCLWDDYEENNGHNPTDPKEGGQDWDNDGLSNKTECSLNIAMSGLYDADLDNDSMKDGFEYTYSFPFKNPTIDAANNGSTCIGAIITYNNGTGPVNDKDCDSLTNLEEQNRGTNPTSTDTDKDNMDDYDEVLAGRHPAVNEPAIISIISSLLLN